MRDRRESDALRRIIREEVRRLNEDAVGHVHIEDALEEFTLLGRDGDPVYLSTRLTTRGAEYSVTFRYWGDWGPMPSASTYVERNDPDHFVLDMDDLDRARSRFIDRQPWSGDALRTEVYSEDGQRTRCAVTLAPDDVMGFDRRVSRGLRMP